VRGEYRPDLVVTSTVHGQYHVEITTPTLAVAGQRGPPRARPGGGARQAPPVDRTRPATHGRIKQAFLRKVNKGQLSKGRPGVIVVVAQRIPGGAVLTAKDVAALERSIADAPHIWELLISMPGERLLRVGARDSGLGLAEGLLHTP
jgi:hypothetical protein